ncbi:unnamed protein product [Amoebophrya sp. A120]|nr:unnamed protein product [Amoebophrya sp. A120]|eukprot:GSA120T00020996001.1
MGNELSNGPSQYGGSATSGVVDAVLQFNDLRDWLNPQDEDLQVPPYPVGGRTASSSSTAVGVTPTSATASIPPSFTAYVSVDNSPEVPLHRGADPLWVKLTLRSIVQIRIVATITSGGSPQMITQQRTVGVCHVPVAKVEQRRLGMVLYHTWLLLEQPQGVRSTIEDQFENSLYNIGKFLQQPKICITLAAKEEYSLIAKSGGIYPLLEDVDHGGGTSELDMMIASSGASSGATGTSSFYGGAGGGTSMTTPATSLTSLTAKKARRYHSVLHSHFQHLQLCQGYYQKYLSERKANYSAKAAGGRGSFANEYDSQLPGGVPSGVAAATAEASALLDQMIWQQQQQQGSQPTATTTTATANSSKEREMLLGQQQSYEQQLAQLRTTVSELGEQKHTLALEHDKKKSELLAEIHTLRTSVAQLQEVVNEKSSSDAAKNGGGATQIINGRASTSTGGSNAEQAQNALDPQRQQETINRLQQETRNITRQANERIDKANDTIRLLRSQAKGLQEKVKLQAAEIATLKGGGTGAATLTTPSASATNLQLAEENRKLQEVLAQERTKKEELMTIVSSLYSEVQPALNPVMSTTSSTGGEQAQFEKMLPSPAEMARSIAGVAAT